MRGMHDMRHPLSRLWRLPLRRVPPLSLREGDIVSGRRRSVHGVPRVACSAAFGLPLRQVQKVGVCSCFMREG